VQLVQAELTRAGFDQQLGAGLVLAGGGARLGWLVGLAEQMLGLPVRLGLPKGLAKMGEILPDPTFASVVGLIMYGNRVRLLRDAREENWFGKLRSVFRGKSG
jgi:cell division protein FtsA